MRWSESLQPVRMTRVALVAPDGEALRAALVTVAGSATVELDTVNGAEPVTATPSGVLPRLSATLSRSSATLPELADTPAELAETAPAPDGERAERAALAAGEAELRRYADAAIRRDGAAGLLGWCPADQVPPLARRLAATGTALVPLPMPRGVDPPTMLRPSPTVGRSFAPLVQTYGTVPYADVDPTLLAGVAYVVMFGMMFADAGHGLMLLAAAFALRAGWPPVLRRRMAKLRRLWPFVAGAGLASTGFGVLFGECFGPTGLVPVRWLSPLEQPVQLLAAGVALGAVLLACAYAVGVVNRWREGSVRLALYAPSGIAGAALFAGLGGLAGGLYFGVTIPALAGAAVAVAGLVLAGIGLYVGSGGGAAGGVQTAVELFDLVIRLGANLVSFARLAAFGLTHAALAGLVWQATTALWTAGGLWAAAAVLAFVLGTAVAFGLEALVAGVQALRLEYYELFSRVFQTEGRPFRPWRVPVVFEEASR